MRNSAMKPVDVAPEFVCLSFIVWGAGSQRGNAAAALALQDNQ
jgi:hypothetical protein